MFMTILLTLLVALFSWLMINLTILLWFARPLWRYWQEPCLKYPIVIFESDDWGPGDHNHTDALVKIKALLLTFRDNLNHPASMSLGIVLATADKHRILQQDCREYVSQSLDQPAFKPLLDTIHSGIRAGCFSPQLHGGEHYWPDTFMTFAQTAQGKAWLSSPETETEDLPSQIQSRWNQPGSNQQEQEQQSQEQQQAIAAEADLYRQIFRESAQILVPPTFVWNENHEAHWAKAGIQCVITPGQRFYQREQAIFSCDIKHISNGQKALTGLTYLVRDDYFEPALGHQWQHALTQLNNKTSLGRPCLYETHRANFIGSTEQKQNSLEQLKQLLCHAQKSWPDLKFLSTPELLHIFKTQPDFWFEKSLSRRFEYWLKRCCQLDRFKRLAGLTGLLTMLSYSQMLSGKLKASAVNSNKTSARQTNIR